MFIKLCVLEKYSHMSVDFKHKNKVSKKSFTFLDTLI